MPLFFRIMPAATDARQNLIDSRAPSSLNLLSTRLARWPRPALVALTFALLALVGVVDYLTGYELSVLIFYLLPVSLAAWFIGRRFAALVSLLSVGIWIVGDIFAGATYTHKIVFAWNATITLGFLLVVAFLLDNLRASLLELESRVRHRTAALTGGDVRARPPGERGARNQ